jgi:acetyl/propionyl-CoA carboxylase alpha subunit
VRNDNGVYSGVHVPLNYDPMLSKLITHGSSREEAILRMRRALTEYRVEGIRTTIPFHLFVMDHPDFRSANFDTGFIDRLLPELHLDHTEGTNIDAAITAAAILAFEDAQNARIPDDYDSRWRRASRLEATGRNDR